MTRALLVVDLQQDFAEEGALACTGGHAVTKRIAAYVGTLPAEELVIASRDDHEPHSDNGGHFSETPDFKTTWPPHCVHGTPGQDYIGDFEASRRDVEVFKGQGCPAYSAFEGTTADGKTLAEVLSDAGVTDLDVCGIAIDYCVRASVLDALKLGLTVRLLARLCVGVSPETVERTFDELDEAGVELAGLPPR